MRLRTFAVASALLAVGATVGPGVAGAQAADAGSLSFAVNPVVRVDRNGTATMTGSYTCVVPDGYTSDGGYVDSSLIQNVGRFHQIAGYGSSGSVICDGAVHSYAFVIVGDGGKFGSGTATYSASGGACYHNDVDYQCADDSHAGTIRLRR